MTNKLLTAVVATLLSAPVLVQATPLHNTTGLTPTYSLETFDINAGHQTAAGIQFAGMTFGAGNMVDNGYSGAFPNMTGSVIANFDPCCTSPTTITFAAALSEVAFAFVSNPQGMLFQAFLGATLVESFTASTNYDGDFYGFTGITFDRIQITGDGASNNAYILDNLQSKAAVPEPISLALFGLGLAGLGFWRRTKKA